MPLSKSLVSNFEVTRRSEAFYTGGQISVTNDAKIAFVPCGSALKVVDKDTGRVTHSLVGDEDSEITCVRASPNERCVLVSQRNLLIKQWSWPEAVLLRTWKTNHRAPVLQIEFNRSEEGIVATGSADFTVKLWDLHRQFCVHTLKGHAGVVSSMCFSNPEPQQTILYVGSAEGEIRVWDLCRQDKAQRCRGVLAPGEGNTVTGIDVQGSLVISCDRNSQITAWNQKSLQRAKQIKLNEAINCFVPVCSKNLSVIGKSASKKLGRRADGQLGLFLAAGENGSIFLVDIQLEQCLWQSNADMFGRSDVTATVMQLVACPLADQYVATTADLNLNVLNAVTLTVEKQLVGCNDEILSAGFLGENDRSLVVGTNSSEVRFYSTEDFSCRLLLGHSDTVLNVATASWDADMFATASKDNNVRLWRVSAKGEPYCFATATGHTNSVSAISFSRGKSRFLVSVAHDRCLKIWPLQDSLTLLPHEKVPVHLQASYTQVAHEKDITSVDVSPNGRLIATGSLDKTVAVWQVAKGGSALERSATLSGNQRGVWDVCFSPVDQIVATAAGDGLVKIFTLDDFTCAKTFEGHQSAALQVKFLPSGLQLVSADSGGIIKLWTIRTNECVKTLEAHEDKIWCLALNSDASTMMSGGCDGALLLWNDCTESDKAVDDSKRAELAAKDQQLHNLLHQKDFSQAFRLALRMCRPHTALKILTDLVHSSDECAVDSLVASLDADQTAQLMKYVTEWNTNSRNCNVAQLTLRAVLRAVPPEQLLQVPYIASTIEALLPYTERHFERLSRLQEQTAFVSYTWKCMRPA